MEKQLDEAPWTLQQTLPGIILTLVPWLAFIIGSQLLTGTAAPKTTHLSLQADLTNAIVVFIISSVIEGAFLIAPLYYANRAFRSIIPHTRLALRSLGFTTFNVGIALSWIFGFIILILMVDVFYQYIITVFHLNLQTNDQVILQESKRAPLTTYATLLVAIFVAPICEETFFRGFVFTGLRHGMPVALAIVISALLFGIAHGDPASFAVLFVIGIALAILRWQTRSLWPGIILHTINNAIGALGIILAMHGIG